MRPLKRRYVNKASSAAKFRGQSARTNKRNITAGPMRGGIRL